MLPRRLPPGSRLWLVFPSPRESRQEAHETLLPPAAISVLPRRLPEDLSSGWYFRAPKRCAAILVLSRRLSPGSRLWLIFPSPREGEGCESLLPPGVLRFLCFPDVSPQELGSGWYFRAPERADSSCFNHWPRLCCSDFSAPQTSPSRISALAGFPSPREGQQ